jgi:hypothetical protein
MKSGAIRPLVWTMSIFLMAASCSAARPVSKSASIQELNTGGNVENANEIEVWQSYHNEMYGLQMKYPITFGPFHEESVDYWTAYAEQPASELFIIRKSPAAYDNEFAQFTDELTRTAAGAQISSSKSTFGGLTGELVNRQITTKDLVFRSFAFQHDSSFFTVTIKYQLGDPPPPFESILSTLTFRN